jgi:hypothetical protein
MKYRAYILKLSGTVRCLGTFDSEELAQTAIDHAQFYRARNNLLLVSVVDVLERACDSEEALRAEGRSGEGSRK